MLGVPVIVSLLIAVNTLVVTLLMSVLVFEFLITPSTLFLERGVRDADCCCCVFVAALARGFRANIAGDVPVVFAVTCGVVWMERSVMVVSLRDCVCVCVY